MTPTWSRSTRFLALALLLGGLLWLLVRVRPLVGPLVIAALTAYVLSPLVAQLETRARLSRARAAAVVYALFLLVSVVSVNVVGPVLVRQAQTVTRELDMLLDDLALPESAESISIFIFELPVSDLAGQASDFLNRSLQAEQAFRVIRAATTNFAWLMIILFSTYYFLRDGRRLADWCVTLAPVAYRADARRLVDDVTQVWYDYLRGQLVLMAFVALLTGSGAALLGLRQAILLGLIAGAMDVVPNVGPLFATAIGVVVAWFEGSRLYPNLPTGALVLLVVAVYGAVQTFENVWLRPRIIGRTMHLHPAIVFVAVIGALVLFGALTALVIIPVIGSIQVVAGYLHRRIIGVPPWPDPDDDPAA